MEVSQRQLYGKPISLLIPRPQLLLRNLLVYRIQDKHDITVFIPDMLSQQFWEMVSVKICPCLPLIFWAPASNSTLSSLIATELFIQLHTCLTFSQDGGAWAMGWRELCSFDLLWNGWAGQCQDDSRQVFWVSKHHYTNNLDTNSSGTVMQVIVSSTLELLKLPQKPSLWTVRWFQTLSVHSNWTGLPAAVFKTVGQSSLNLFQTLTSILESLLLSSLLDNLLKTRIHSFLLRTISGTSTNIFS